MARPRIQISSGDAEEIRERTSRGESAVTIKAAMPWLPSKTWIEAEQAKMRGKAGARGPLAETPAQPAVALEEIPDAVPEGTSLEQIDRWIVQLETAARTAELQCNLSALASLAARSATLMSLRHRLTPPAPRDPNENPDMRALAAQGRERLKKLAHAVFQPAG